MTNNISLLSQSKTALLCIVVVYLWQYGGYIMLIYITGLTQVPGDVLEAADIDGATRMQKIIHINIPTILPTIVIMLILRMGQIASVGYEKVYLMQNELNVSTAEVISTYVYKKGLLDGDYGFSTAVGLFNTVINVILLISMNKIVQRLNEGKGI